MKPAPLIIGILSSLLLLFATTMVVVRFVPGAGEFFGGSTSDLYSDGHCETHRNPVYELSYALLGQPGEKRMVTQKVKVLDPAGAPIPQARVRVDLKGSSGSRSGTTDSGGRVELSLGEEFESAKATLWIDAPGYVDTHQEVAVGDEEVSVRLVALLLFRGSLVDELGQPIHPVRVYANGCRPVSETAPDGTFELHCRPDFPVVVMGVKALREEDAFRLDAVKQLPQREGEVATLTGRRSGARARITLPGGSVGGSWVRLARADGRDASTVEAGWQDGDTFGFLGLEEGHWWVYFHRQEEPSDALHRTELVAVAGRLAELELPLDAPQFMFDRASSR